MTNPASGLINHISLSCSDLAKSRKFYDFFLGELLGYHTIMDQPYCVMYAKGGASLSVATHDEIDQYHAKIVDFYKIHGGGTAEKSTHGHVVDAPSLYPQYAKHYYAVFFTDPDGIKLELVYNEGY
ncbi:hypothetical protein BG006_008339 [Podila minutissima]|uniref:VOC domain-containing protein n=1 Tax=Podila minutissima TaxID=64525 RepID=A0A9P5STR7_9FUNG|nr:hypothetical protein BG006_008339 [Podila minutissima]